MISLSKVWKNFRLENEAVLFCFDYDGTLTPIAEHPRLARLKRGNLKVLKILSRIPDVRLAIFTGRGINDIKNFVKIKNMYYAGNHGLEISGPSISHVFAAGLKSKKTLRLLAARLEKAFESLKGIWVENKVLSLSVHYRQARPAHVFKAQKLFEKTLAPYIRAKAVRVTEGKKVWEVRPPFWWDKGSRLRWFVSAMKRKWRRSFHVIYFGDDETDEDVFHVLRGNEIGVKVGGQPGQKSYAAYSISSPDGIMEILKKFIIMKTSKERRKRRGAGTVLV